MRHENAAAKKNFLSRFRKSRVVTGSPTVHHAPLDRPYQRMFSISEHGHKAGQDTS